MIYILEQRLRAQNIAREKAVKVLADVCRTMFSAAFVSELFRPQECYSNKATRQVFDRLAHSSIMRLNKGSMDKLYDLMTMGLKQQIFACASPTWLLALSLTHLDGIKAILGAPSPTTASAVELLDSATRQMVSCYAGLPLGELFRLRQCLLRFFQDRRIKVSIFLQHKLQNLDGQLNRSQSLAGSLPIGTEPPGAVRYYGITRGPAGPTGAARTQTPRQPQAQRASAFARSSSYVPASENRCLCDPGAAAGGANVVARSSESVRGRMVGPAAEATGPNREVVYSEGDMLQPSARPTWPLRIGSNQYYSKEKDATASDGKAADGKEAEDAADGGDAAQRSNRRASLDAQSAAGGAPGTGAAAATLLAGLIRAGAPPTDTAAGFIPIYFASADADGADGMGGDGDLFGIDNSDADGSDGPSSPSLFASSGAASAADPSARIQHLMQRLDLEGDADMALGSPGAHRPSRGPLRSGPTRSSPGGKASSVAAGIPEPQGEELLALMDGLGQ
jgi:hypothetical protein